MNQHINEFFSEYSDDGKRGNFHRVHNLCNCIDVDWDTISNKFPQLTKGWYELSLLNSKDKIEFTRDYWLSQLSYHQNLSTGIANFFNDVEDILIYITQNKWDDPYEVSMVYSLRNNRGFYKGRPPASESDIEILQNFFNDFILPKDFLAFLKIHNGFTKTTDITGILASLEIIECYRSLQQALEKKDLILSSKGEIVEPKTLIPFYKSFGMPYFQCFWGQWYPENEMGNLYYSYETNQIPQTDIIKSSPENLAFTSFSDWLMFYLESAF